MGQQRFASQRVQDLGKSRLHALSHACGKNDYIHKQLVEMTQNSSMRPPRKLAQVAGMLLLVVLLAGCSMARLGYNNAETVSYFWLNSYIGFDADQKPWVKKEIAGLVAWHRRTQLQEYAQLLAEAQQRVYKPVTEAELAGDYEKIRGLIAVMI